MSRDRQDEGADRLAERPSRSERKREHQALQRLAVRALGLPAARLRGLGLEVGVLDALRAGQAIKASAARERHVRHLANLLASDPQAAAAIGAALDRDSQGHALEVARFHALERWRDRLLAEGDAALAEFVDAHPGADATTLRTQVRQAAKDAGTPRQGAAARRLFQALKAVAAVEREDA
jgi:ribosome-associated protein